MDKKIKIAIVGLGNCASSLIQGIEYYRHHKDSIGLMHPAIGGYEPEDIEVVAAFDIDARKVGVDVSRAIFMPPNCTKTLFSPIPEKGVKVEMGKILDSVAPHMQDYPPESTFVLAKKEEPTLEKVVQILKKTGAEMLLNYLPVGSSDAVYFYANAALEANIGFLNCIPVFIASDDQWAKKFEKRNLPLIGDDIKSQLGATIVHRQLADLFQKRGVKILRTYQLNTGGNTDFLNMLDRGRLTSKKKSKTEAVQSILAKRLEKEDIHIGPSDYVPWQKDNKVCFLRMEGEIFGKVPIHLEMRLSVEDSPNSAGVAIDMIRCCKMALLRKEGGVIYPAAAYFCKHPPRQYSDDIAYSMLEEYLVNHTSHKIQLPSPQPLASQRAKDEGEL